MEARSTLLLLGFRQRRSRDPALRPAVLALCRARAIKRWSALLTQTKSRIASHMRRRLGEANWKAFVRYAETRHKEAFVRALVPQSGVLCCGGKIDGAPCPRGARIDLHTVPLTNLGDLLPNMHMDHTHDVAHICDVWSRALPPDPASWDAGICGELVAHLLFGAEDHVLAACSPRPIWRRQVIMRCGNASGAGQNADRFCHDVSNAHYGHALHVADLAWPPDEADGADGTGEGAA